MRSNLIRTNIVAAAFVTTGVLALAACQPADEQQVSRSDLRTPSADQPAAQARSEPTPSGLLERMTTDASLTAKVTTALQADAEVGGLDIGVRTENGIVTLTGSGLDAAKSERAMQIAKSVDGVKGVLGNFS